MSQSRESLIKRYESLARTHEAKGKREWAYAKNDMGDEHYGIARNAFSKGKEMQSRADALKRD